MFTLTAFAICFMSSFGGICHVYSPKDVKTFHSANECHVHGRDSAGLMIQLLAYPLDQEYRIEVKCDKETRA